MALLNHLADLLHVSIMLLWVLIQGLACLNNLLPKDHHLSHREFRTLTTLALLLLQSYLRRRLT